MSERPQLVAGLGWRQSDARAIWSIFNRAAMAVAEGSPRDEITAARRMRLLAFWLQRAADDLTGIDIEEAAIAEVAAFWRRRSAGERGEDDADAA
jgi:hypothetical protein